jgi:magnesium chelatase family protein
VIGGGTIPGPGEVSLAHRGVLFLDELPEFGRNVLETLRQPLEDGSVTICRAQGSVRFPARFMLVAALNPTPRGSNPEGDAGHRAMERYLSRLSGPLVDRIDIHTEVPAVPYRQLSAPANGADTATLRAAVADARRFAAGRQGSRVNGALAARDLDALCGLTPEAAVLLGQALNELGLSARAYDKLRRVSRTIADLESSERVEAPHMLEAVQYRLLDRELCAA